MGKLVSIENDQKWNKIKCEPISIKHFKWMFRQYSSVRIWLKIGTFILSVGTWKKNWNHFLFLFELIFILWNLNIKFEQIYHISSVYQCYAFFFVIFKDNCLLPLPWCELWNSSNNWRLHFAIACLHTKDSFSA